MSETLDVNVLVYGTDPNSPFHEASRTLLDRLAGGPAPVRLLWPALFGYLRLVTARSVLDAPLTPREAQENVTDLLRRPHVRVLGEKRGFWSTYESVAGEVQPRGNLVSDTHLVALMREHEIATIWTYDRDFRKFSGITAREP
jgi:uncharacterized protein